MLFKLLTKLSNNSFTQNKIELTVRKLLYLMGFGCGGIVLNSGEKRVFDQLKHKESICLFDVGANKGDYIKLFLTDLGNKNYSIHAFEPGHFTFNTLNKNIIQSKNIIINNFGLGSINGTFSLFYNEDGIGIASLTKRRLDHLGVTFDKEEKVKIVTLDDYCREKKIGLIDLLKIDVEGHELDVLEGSTQMLKEEKIDMITFEFGGCNIDSKTYFQDFYYFFKKYNYQIYRITAGGFHKPIKQYKEFYEQFVTTNYIAKKLH